mmetsp:Transcript_28087/g.71600  ORF Transcript_28087/g.71600 Transcript_28087/m.71600 type:complete len:244 (+) Transcript_28087:560-1291(+)
MHSHHLAPQSTPPWHAAPTPLPLARSKHKTQGAWLAGQHVTAVAAPQGVPPHSLLPPSASQRASSSGHVFFTSHRMARHRSVTTSSGRAASASCSPSTFLAPASAARTAVHMRTHMVLGSCDPNASSTCPASRPRSASTTSSCMRSRACWSRIMTCCAAATLRASAASACAALASSRTSASCPSSLVMVAACAATCPASTRFAPSSSIARASIALSAASCAVSVSTADASPSCSAFLRSRYLA